ncbi:MAG: hypothetical protein JO253_04665 [Alphaproteobacteria bacterium]|nr:hypothetical protein [Alphaproteobacteria bacterium]
MNITTHDGLPQMPWDEATVDIEAWIEIRTGEEIVEAIRTYARSAVLAEREACADIVDNANSPDCGGWNMNHIAERIRARK